MKTLLVGHNDTRHSKLERSRELKSHSVGKLQILSAQTQERVEPGLHIGPEMLRGVLEWSGKEASSQVHGAGS